IGSETTYSKSSEEPEATSVHVLVNNPLAPWKRRYRLDRLSHRDHRKILDVDGTVGFTGGVNLADQWLPEEEDGQSWRDDMVCVEEPAVRGFLRCLAGAWRRSGRSSRRSEEV